MKENEKTPEEIKKQDYISIKDLMILIPNIKYERARELIKATRNEMKEKKYYVPVVKEKLALTKMVLKKLGI